MPEQEDPTYLLSQAERCRNLAKTATDERMRVTLLGMAKQYEERAEQAGKPRR